MKENTKKFLEAIRSNEELKTKIEELEKQKTEDAINEIISLAAEYGCELTAKDFEKETDCKLSEEALEAVAGGYLKHSELGKILFG